MNHDNFFLARQEDWYEGMYDDEDDEPVDMTSECELEDAILELADRLGEK